MIAAAGTALASAPAQAAESYFCGDNTQPYVPVAVAEAYSPGEAVTGLSVTSGTTPEGFTGSYVGYIADALGTGKDLLLFRLSSDVIDGTSTTRGAGIWAGMSGSPVYDGSGRLIGAVAYSLTTENLPIAGVTPAEYMKSIGSTGFAPAGKIHATSANLKLAPSGTTVAGTSLAGTSFSQIKTVNVAGPAGAAANAFANRTLARTPAGGPVASFLRSKSFQAAGATKAAGVPSTLVAGGTVAALYTSGDLIVGGIGTVTAICGNSVWAFGHPMSFQGKSSALMANASTALIVPDAAGLIGSYKQTSQIGAPIGMITEDRLVGIKGTLGATRSFGVSVTVQNAAGAHVADYQANVSEPIAGPSAVAALTGQAAVEQLDQDAGGTAQVSWTIDYTRASGAAESLANSQFLNADEAFADLVGSGVGQDLSAIVSNKFEDVTITGVSVTVKLLSADSISYQPKDVQVQVKGKWTSLDGRRLKAGSRYTLRPVYTVVKNGRSGADVVGNTVSVTLSKKAAKKGGFVLAATAVPPQDCSSDSVGSECDLSSPTDDAASFDDVIAILDALDPGNQLSGTLTYKKKKGSSTRTFSWETPAAVAGQVEVAFRIKR
ncbi:MAG: hypothetical protein LWW77_08910 [Propionibacteriales bacterium]|nr:hypothetical protein [Propionibacteriales bacterium]